MDFLIPKTESTPEVSFKAEQGVVEIKGVSIPEDTDQFYLPLLDKIEAHIRTKPKGLFRLVLRFIYINTGTSASVAKTLRALEVLTVETERDIRIEWHYEKGDEDMKELGDYFESFTSLSFEKVPCNEIS
jgi:hypothetical protein